METDEIFRLAKARGVQAEAYDPNQLALDVEQLLRDRGLHPDGRGRMGMATGGAGTILRAFGIVPGGDYTTIDRHNAPDADER